VSILFSSLWFVLGSHLRAAVVAIAIVG
jgi:hypothetical protein